MVLAVLSQSLVRAEEHRTAANALLCASPLTIKDAYQAVLASDRKWLQELNCIQAKAGLKVTVIERNSLGWQVRVNTADNSIKLPQTEHTATIGRAEWKAQATVDLGTGTNLREANKSSGRPARASRNPVTPLDQCCVHQAEQEAATGNMMFWASWLEFRATNGSYLDSEGRPLKIR
jgi:hypothetical protein